jgi:hypothetical protein
MYRLLRRTSITEDEAVSMLLGHTTGPVEFEIPEGDEEYEANCPMFCLGEALEGELEVLDGQYRLAKRDKQPAHVIAEKLAALQRQEGIIQQARVHLSAFRDELNKGERSVLKVDSALSNAAYTYITLHSFEEWVQHRQSQAGGQPGTTIPTDIVPMIIKEKEKKAPRTKGLRQQDAILAEIERRGFVATALPPHPYNGRGVKAVVLEAIAKPPLFPSPKVFDTAWQTLRRQKLIAGGARPSSPKKV